jgi:hypothetical protein
MGHRKKETLMNARSWFALLAGMACVSTTASASSTLLIGDSHSVGAFGKTLDSLMRADQTREVRTVASCGSIIRWFYTGTPTPCGFLQIDTEGKVTESLKSPTPLLSGLLAEQKPDLIIVELGANYMVGYPDATLVRDVEQLLKDIDSTGAKCLWVSPPDSRKYREQRKLLVARLEKLVSARCQWFDSLQFTRYPDTGGDGVHYSTSTMIPIAKEWATQVHRVVESL